MTKEITEDIPDSVEDIQDEIYNAQFILGHYSNITQEEREIFSDRLDYLREKLETDFEY